MEKIQNQHRNRLLSFLFSHETDRSILWRNATVLILLCLGLWGWTCGLWDLWGPDETRYVQVSKELLSRRNWFILTLQDLPYDQKPPLPFWLLAGMLKMSNGEVQTALLRLPSISFAILSVVMCYLIGRRLWGEQAGLISSIVLLTSAQFIEDAPTTELNVMYTGWTTLTLALWFLSPKDQKFSWSRFAVFWGSLAGAFFTKGPLALLVVFSCLAGESIASRSLSPLTRVRLFPGVIGLFFLIGGWLFLQKEWAGSEFVVTQIKEQTLDRFLSGSHKAPFWYYFPRLFTSIFLPWGVFLFPAALRLKRFGRQLPSGMAALIGWIIFPFLVLTLAAGKRQSYLLPLLPALALIVGWYLNQVMIEKKYYPRLGNSLRNLLFIVGGGILFLSILIGIVPSMLDRYGLAIHHFGCILSAFWGTLIMSLGVWIDKGEKRSSRLFAGLACLVMVLSLLQFSVINPAMNPLKTTKPFALMLNKMTLDLHLSQIGTIGRANKPEYHVYGNYRLVTYKTDDVVENPSALLPVLVGREEEWEEISRSITLKDYKPVWAGEVSRDKIVVYIKEDGQN